MAPNDVGNNIYSIITTPSNISWGISDIFGDLVDFEILEDTEQVCLAPGDYDFYPLESGSVTISGLCGSNTYNFEAEQSIFFTTNCCIIPPENLFENNKSVSWNVTQTGENHTILLPQNPNILKNGSDIPVATGFIGLFKTIISNSEEKLQCMGYTQINNSSSTQITVMGAFENTSGLDTEQGIVTPGYVSDETFQWRVYDCTQNTFFEPIVEYNLLAPNSNKYVKNGVSAILSKDVSEYIQIITLPEGWSLFSSYIEITNVVDTLRPVITFIELMKDMEGNVFKPYTINQIGKNSVGKAYYIKMTKSATLSITGKLASRNIKLNPGWNMIGCINNRDISIDDTPLSDGIINSIGGRKIIEIEGDGESWKVDTDGSVIINTLSSLQPGKGYLCKTSDRASLDLNVSFFSEMQSIILPQGWSTFSTYIQPVNDSMESVLASITDYVEIVKDINGNVFIPYNEFNNLALNNTQGYLIKMSQARNLDISGPLIDYPFTITLSTGWNMISYPLGTSKPVEEVFANIIGVNIVKSYTGDIYYPDWDYNTIGNMTPGQGYLVNVNVNEDSNLVFTN